MSSLRDFRDAVRQEAERTPAPDLAAMLGRAPTAGFRWSWAAGAAAAAVLVSIGYSYYAEQKRIEQDRADAALMEEVNSALSRSVPRALEPLLGENRCTQKSC